MKSIRGIIIGLGLFALPFILHAQTATLGSLNGGAISVQPPANDSIVQVAAESQGLDLVAREDLPRGGTFWLVMPSGIAAPMPCPPSDQTLPIYQICGNQFLVDATGGQVAVRPSLSRGRTAQPLTSSQIASALVAQAGAVVDFIGQIQDAQYTRELAASFGMDFPGFGGGGGGDYTNSLSFTGYTFDTNQLWLEFTNVSNGIAYINLHNGTNPVYAIWTTTNLLSPFAQWQMAMEVWPADTGCQSFSLPTLNQDLQFYRAEDWSTKDSDNDGIPDWWTWNYFGSPTLADTSLDYSTNGLGYGCTFGYEYSNNITPTVFRFTGIHATNNYVGTSQTAGQLDVAGTPYYIAVSVDDTNFFTNTTWNVYSSATVPVNLGSVEGWHDVWIGLRGHADTAAHAVWQHHWLKLDTTPPTLVITNPVMAGGAATVDIPLIQIQGYSPEALSRVSYDLTNAAGAISNQPALILNQYYDPNMAEYTTNWFQAFDVFLTNGLNAFTFHATDLAGNVATVNYNVTVDYSAKTNPPNVQLIWPTNGMSIASDTVTIRGLLDDATVKMVASVTDTNNVTNIISGVVERDGRFWLDNVPLMAGTNVIALTATDAAGNVTTNQLTLQRSLITVTVNTPVITNASQTTVSVTGTVSDQTAIVWVNGVEGITSGTNWSADNVPVTRGGVAIFDVMAYPVDEAPDPGSGGGGMNPPPTPGSGSGGIGVDMPPSVYLYEDNQAIGDKSSGTTYIGWNHDESSESDSESHSSHWWMPGWGGAGGESSHSDGKHYDGGILDGESIVNMNGSYDLDGNGNGWETGTVVTDGNSSPFSKDVLLGLTWWIGSEHCEVVDVKSDKWDSSGGDNQWYGGTSHDSYTRSAQTTYHVQTGGRAVPGRQNLWRLSGWASKITDKHATPPFWFTPTEAIDPGQIQIRGKSLDTNGNVYLILPDGQDMDVTPQVSGMEFYVFGVGGQKYYSYFEVYVKQPYPGTQTTLSDYTGHAFWGLDTDAPDEAIAYLAPSLQYYINANWGFYPNGPDCGLTGQLQNDDTHPYSVRRVFYIGFNDLISGLQFTRGIDNEPPVYCYRSYSCVGASQDAGHNVGITLPSFPLLDLFPQNYGADILKRFPGPLDDPTPRYSN